MEEWVYIPKSKTMELKSSYFKDTLNYLLQDVFPLTIKDVLALNFGKPSSSQLLFDFSGKVTEFEEKNILIRKLKERGEKRS